MVVASHCGFCQNYMDASRFNVKFSFTLTDFNAILEEFQQQTGADYQFHGCETQLTLPKKFGAGSLRFVRLQDGLNLYVNEHVLEENLVLECLETSSEYSQIVLKFYLSGLMSGSIRGINDEMLGLPGSCAFIHWPEGMAGAAEFVSGSKICTIDLSITPELLRAMIDESDESHPVELQRLLNSVQVPYRQPGQTSPLMAIALQQILHCPYQGATRRLYLESKGLELIALYLDQLKAEQPSPPKTYRLKPEDISQIYQARDILIRQMDSPPSLPSLARQVGINQQKLKQGTSF
ncbi:MAG: hypothetical protein F6K09_14220 [Merismopedia sp. SIO2A8]|nr:hypothetical protein [Merismopedia sp. SIO2A8]